MSLWIRRAEVEGSIVDLRCDGGRVLAVGPALPEGPPGERVLDAAGGALLPGLHDHHIHLLALAAADASLRCGPPEVTSAAELSRALRHAAASGAPVRGIAYHESVAGTLDREALDAIVPTVPVRIQHRSGACWMLNGAALAALDLDVAPPGGVERHSDGTPTGRLFRLDAWLRAQEPPRPPDLRPVGERLARLGLTGVTDATPDPAGGGSELLADAAASGALPQRVMTLSAGARRGIAIDLGPRKIVLDEPRLPALDELQAEIAAAHRSRRGVAIHCVTRTELFFAIAALDEAGPDPADRIEHASVAPPEAARALARLGVTVVTQPSFVFERGEDYLRDVDPSDRPWLYRCEGFLREGVPLGGGSDAPFGDPDPWQGMRAAVDRKTRAGRAIGPDERLSPERALALFTTAPDAPGGVPRRLEVGTRADAVLLAGSWRQARDRLDATDVAVTIVGGRIVWQRR